MQRGNHRTNALFQSHPAPDTVVFVPPDPVASIDPCHMLAALAFPWYCMSLLKRM